MHLLLTFPPRCKVRPGGGCIFTPVLLEACRFHIWCPHYIILHGEFSKPSSLGISIRNSLWFGAAFRTSKMGRECVVPRFWTGLFFPCGHLCSPHLWCCFLTFLSHGYSFLLFTGFSHFSTFHLYLSLAFIVSGAEFCFSLTDFHVSYVLSLTLLGPLSCQMFLPSETLPWVI